MERLKSNSKSGYMGTEPIIRLIIKFALPSILGMLAHSLYNIVDRIFVGHYVGPDGLAATILCFPYMMLTFALSIMPGAGGGALISIALGEQKKPRAEKVLGNGLFMAFVASLIMSVTGYNYAASIIQMSGGSGAIGVMAEGYFNIIVIGVPISTCAFAMSGYIRAQGSPKYAMGALICGALCNIVLDAVFVVYFGWGVRGAAIATVLSQFISFIWSSSFFVFKIGELRVHFVNFIPAPSIILRIFMLGLSPAITESAFALFMFLCNRALSFHGGDLAISAMGIFMGWDSLLFLPVLGIGEAVQPLFGYNYGALLFRRVEAALKTAITLACGYFLFSAFVVCFFTEFMIRMFTNDQELINIAVVGMRISYAGVIFVGITIVTNSYIQGIGRARLSIFLTFCRHLLFLFPAILIFPKYWGLTGVWASFPVVDLCGGALSVILLLYLHFKNKREGTVD
ncbi:MAG: MATE family efflux transporter [Synergistaceae bacterium]|nr:MATE family efflux transporter [Synergistaceae bacterium]